MSWNIHYDGTDWWVDAMAEHRSVAIYFLVHSSESLRRPFDLLDEGYRPTLMILDQGVMTQLTM